MSGKDCFIEVTELRAIRSSSDCWMLMKRTKLTDKATKKPIGGYSDWSPYKYFADFDKAAVALEQELIRRSGATTFAELSRFAEKIHAMMLETLERGKV